MSKRATIIDVAKQAKVSWKTVSRVINREPNVSAGTIARVEAAIRELEYRPNVAARSLAGSSDYLIGVLVCNPSSHYQMALHLGAARVCLSRGYHLVHEVVDLAAPDFPAGFERHLRGTSFRGIVLPPPGADMPALLDVLDANGIRYVRIDPLSEPDRSDLIVARDADGIGALVEHLWALGHRRYALVEGPASHRASHVRLAAVREALEGRGLSAGALITVPGDFSFRSGVDAGRRLFRDHRDATAVIATNDEMAAGVVTAAHEAGIAVPADVSVAGFDDSDVAQLAWPPLTTVRQPIARMAEIAVERLTEPPVPGPGRVYECDVELVLRQSTGPARPG